MIPEFDVRDISYHVDLSGVTRGKVPITCVCEVLPRFEGLLPELLKFCRDVGRPVHPVTEEWRGLCRAQCDVLPVPPGLSSACYRGRAPRMDRGWWSAFGAVHSAAGTSSRLRSDDGREATWFLVQVFTTLIALASATQKCYAMS